MCFVGNVGDSRSCLSSNVGEKVFYLSTDHKPNEPSEEERIIKNGGKVYQSSNVIKIPNTN
jgi:serine/threonine protein phosphatase PrpC